MQKSVALCEPKYDLVHSAYLKWFHQQRAKGTPMSGVILQEKAGILFTKLYPNCDPDAFKVATKVQPTQRHQERDTAR